MSADWGPELSVIWTDRHFSLGRSPLLDRIDYLDHRVVLHERERVRPGRPRLQQVQVTWLTRHLRNGPTSVRRFATAESP